MTRALAFLLCAPLLSAATLYCGPSATGNSSGSDFNNLAAFTGGGTRGNTYKLIDGSYGAITLGTAASGTTRIIIEKVSSSDSAVAGYAGALHDGQATFGQILVNDPYYTLDGKTRSTTALGVEPAGYGFRIANITSDSTNSDDGTGLNVYYAQIGAAWNTSPDASTIDGYGPAVKVVYNKSGLIVSHCALHNCIVMGQITSTIGATYEYCDFYHGYGKEALAGPNADISDLVVRYCRFLNSTQANPNDGSSGVTAEIGVFSDGVTAEGCKIYGNVFYHSLTGTGRNAIIALGELGDTAVGNNNLVYNNTFVIADTCVFGAIRLAGGTGNVVRNNLFAHTAGSTTINANTTSDNDVAASGAQFTNFAGLDFTLASATGAGTTLSSPYDTDPLGVTRGADGTWDVGAYDYVSGGGGSSTSATTTNLNTTTLNVGP